MFDISWMIHEGDNPAAYGRMPGIPGFRGNYKIGSAKLTRHQPQDILFIFIVFVPFDQIQAKKQIKKKQSRQQETDECTFPHGLTFYS